MVHDIVGFAVFANGVAFETVTGLTVVDLAFAYDAGVLFLCVKCAFLLKHGH